MFIIVNFHSLVADEDHLSFPSMPWKGIISKRIQYKFRPYGIKTAIHKYPVLFVSHFTITLVH